LFSFGLKQIINSYLLISNGKVFNKYKRIDLVCISPCKISGAKKEYKPMIYFLSTGGTSTGEPVCLCVCPRKKNQKIGLVIII
jgi:hypothetical protein